jgi:iron-sulfur cluster protein
VSGLYDYDALKKRARAIKEESIERLPELIEQVRDAIEARGGTVYLAHDAADANRYVADLCRGARRIVKSKSMTTEEIELNGHLEAAGMEVVETDLGEWVLQLADESPSHLVAPALHKSRASIAELFNARFDSVTPPETAEELTRFARKRLWTLIKGADIGITGANFIAADSGTLALVTSEGNARKTALIPPCYIAVAGVEKIIPSVEDLQPFVELIGRSGTGQDITSYLSLFTPPFDTPPVAFDAQHLDKSERSFHLVLIDNGRMAMRNDEQLRETLYCIRCGACSNVCANFQQVGGHAFGGHTYTGGIATGWEAGLHGPEAAKSFNDLCTGCSRCVPACPVNIDIPWINVVVRDRINSGREGAWSSLVEGLRPDSMEANGGNLQKNAVASFQTMARWGSRTAPISNWVNQWGPVRAIMEWVLGIDRRRSLPVFQRETLTKWFQKRQGASQNRQKSVVLYPDAYTNYILTGRGKAAVRALEALGIAVHIPQVFDSGRPALSQGLISVAERKAQQVFEALRAHIDAGRDVIVIEPTDLAMFRRDYEKLLPAQAYRQLCDHSFEIMEYLNLVLKSQDDLSSLSQCGLVVGDGRGLAYHSHCQQRTLKLEGPTVAVLERLGYDVWTSSVECCGMAGSFGYKADFYELSMQVGKELRDQLTSDKADGRTPVASGVSCQEQIEDLISRSVMHPIEIIAPRGGSKTRQVSA